MPAPARFLSIKCRSEVLRMGAGRSVYSASVLIEKNNELCEEVLFQNRLWNKCARPVAVIFGINLMRLKFLAGGFAKVFLRKLVRQILRQQWINYNKHRLQSNYFWKIIVKKLVWIVQNFVLDRRPFYFQIKIVKQFMAILHRHIIYNIIRAPQFNTAAENSITRF